MLILNSQNECYSNVLNVKILHKYIRMQQHLKELGYYQIKIKYLKNTLTCF